MTETFNDAKQQRKLVDFASLPSKFPTHCHPPRFWEALGRTVATFGFLEEILAKAIFALTATTLYPVNEIEIEYKKWRSRLEGALSDPLYPLIESYSRALREHQNIDARQAETLLGHLEELPPVRNALCHGSWRAPNADGKSSLWYFNKKLERFETLVDETFLSEVQRHTCEASLRIIESVTSLGLNFPGSNSPGVSPWPASK